QDATASITVAPVYEAIRHLGAPKRPTANRYRSESAGMTTVVSTSACHAYGDVVWARSTAATLVGTRGCSSMVELQPSKLATRVRFPPPASIAERAVTAAPTFGFRKLLAPWKPACAQGRS